MSEEYSMVIPTKWIYATLGEVCHITAGNPAPQDKMSFKSGTIPFVRVQDMGRLGSQTYITTTNDKINREACRKLSLFKKGTVLFTKSGASTLNNQRAILGVDAFVVSHIGTAKPFSGISEKWIYFCLKQIDFADLAQSSIMPSLRLSKVSDLKIPIPPTSEQHCIIAKIEQLFSELDKGVAELKKARETMALYRQSLLKAAFEGRLTEKWRREHADELESADQLLARIKTEREKHYRQQMEDWKQAVKDWETQSKLGRKPSKPRKPEGLRQLTKEELSELPKLPDGWIWRHLGDITDLTAGHAFKKNEYSKVGVRLFQIANVTFGKTVWDDVDFLPESYLNEWSALVLKKGDVLLALNRPLLQRRLKICRLSESDLPAILYQRVGRLGFYIDGYEDYVMNFMQGPIFISEFEKDLQGIDIPFINKGKLLGKHVPLCSKAEAVAIMQELGNKFSVIDDTSEAIEKSIKQADVLRQSILKKAFSGKLVPQDPNDEPASELLKRIQAERDKTVKEKKPIRKTLSKREKRQMADLLTALRQAGDWVSAQEAFRQCGISDGAETDQIEALYIELRDLEKAGKVGIERRGEQDWLKLQATREAQDAS